MDALSIDLADILSGGTYPRDEVAVYLDAQTAYEVSKVEAELEKRPDDEELQEKLAELIRKGSESKFVFHIRGASRGDEDLLLKKTLEVFPLQYNTWGKVMPNREADNYHANLKWAFHIEKIVRASDGAEVPPMDETDAAALRASLPKPVAFKIEDAIERLSEGESRGFDTLAKDVDFLSQR